MRTVAAVLALVACVHAGLWALLRTTETAPDVTGQLASVSYAPFADSSHPDTGQRPTAEQIRPDLKAIAPYTRAPRPAAPPPPRTDPPRSEGDPALSAPHPHLFVDRRRRAGAADRRRIRSE